MISGLLLTAATTGQGDASGGVAVLIIGCFILLCILLVYFLPYVIAKQRKADGRNLIFFVNLIIGWTVIGWLACIIWACTIEKEKKAPAIEVI